MDIDFFSNMSATQIFYDNWDNLCCFHCQRDDISREIKHVPTPRLIYVYLRICREYVHIPVVFLCDGRINTQTIHLVVCLKTRPKPLPKRALHIVRSRTSSFKWQHPLLPVMSSSSFPRLLPCLPKYPMHFTKSQILGIKRYLLHCFLQC